MKQVEKEYGIEKKITSSHMSQGRAIQRDNPTYAIKTVSSVYANVCKELGPDYDNVDDFDLPRASPEPYEILDWIGTGKYSDVFTAIDHSRSGEIVAIKVLKPVRQQKYNREAKILLNLKDGPNIVKLYEIVQNPVSLQYSFVFENITDSNYQDFFSTMSHTECCFYLYQLMRAIHYAHSRGVMHRDVKPLNILFDRKKKKLRLIDWGLAEFYHPQEYYNIHVASRNYKPIELLIDYQCYDYSVDIWSFGVTMAGMVLKRTPFFRGKDDVDMVSKIVAVLGNDPFKEYLAKYDIPLPKSMQMMIARGKPRPWSYFVNAQNEDLATENALDLIDKCIRYDHTQRITAEEALKHPYFDPVRNMPAS